MWIIKDTKDATKKAEYMGKMDVFGTEYEGYKKINFVILVKDGIALSFKNWEWAIVENAETNPVLRFATAKGTIEIYRSTDHHFVVREVRDVPFVYAVHKPKLPYILGEDTSADGKTLMQRYLLCVTGKDYTKTVTARPKTNKVHFKRKTRNAFRNKSKERKETVSAATSAATSAKSSAKE